MSFRLSLRFASFGFALLFALRGNADTPWAVKDQPYRAVVKIGAATKNPDAGVAVELPEFGFTVGRNPAITMTDGAGKIIPVNVLWHSFGEAILLQAQTISTGAEAFIYFGGAPVRTSPSWQARTSLLLETRRAVAGAKLDTPQEMEDAWRRAAGQVDGVGFVRSIFLGENPFGENTNFLSKFTGYLHTDGMKDVQLYTVSSDASFVFIEGKYELGWPGIHTTAPNEKNTPNKKIAVSGALTKIEYYHAKTGPGGPAIGLLWKRGAKAEQVPADQFVHAATSEIVRIEGQQGKPAPFPKIKFDSYIGYNDLWLFETTCSVENADGWDVGWAFDDGAVFKGPKCTRVIPGLAPVKLTVVLQKGGETLSGTRMIRFHDNSIHAASIENPDDVARYVGLITQENAAHLSPHTLRADIAFLGEFAEDPQIAPFAEAFSQAKADTSDPLWLQSQLTRLRAIAQTDPARALSDLRKIDPQARNKFASDFDVLEIDLLVFYLQEPVAADLARRYAFSHKEPEVIRLLQTRIGDSYRILGKIPEAIAQYQSVQKSVGDESAGRKLPAQDRAYSIEIGGLIADGHRKEAEQKLNEWESRHPMAKVDSDFLVLRARLLMLLGRWKEAVMEIESFEKMQPDSPYQIEGDFYRARALFETGKKDEARKMWTEIVTKYPKHEFAQKSKEWLSKK